MGKININHEMMTKRLIRRMKKQFMKVKIIQNSFLQQISNQIEILSKRFHGNNVAEACLPAHKIELTTISPPSGKLHYSICISLKKNLYQIKCK